jgi:hypothetical protein
VVYFFSVRSTKLDLLWRMPRILSQPWAQIEAQETRQRNREVGVAVRVDSQLRHLHPLLSHHPFDGGTGLAFIEHNRLGVEDPPTIAHVAVNADGGCLESWILACLLYPAAPMRWSSRLRSLLTSGSSSLAARGGQLQLVIHAQRSGARGSSHRVDTYANACKQRCEEATGLGRQMQPSVVSSGFGLRSSSAHPG